MSVIYDNAAALYARTKAAYDLVHLSAYVAAETACNGVLLNARGKREGVDPWELFHGTHARAYAHASPELVEHWASYARITYTEFERQMIESDPS